MGGPLDNTQPVGDNSKATESLSPFLAQLQEKKPGSSGQDMERVNGSTPWRATYGNDIQNNYRQGDQQQQQQQQQQSQRPWRATYGEDVQNNYRPGTEQQAGSQPWRQTYGNDVQNNYRPGDGSNTGSGSSPWRQTYGNDVGTTYQPGGQQQQQGGDTPWRPPYNQTAPIAPGGGGDPNRNGDQGNGPVWKPKPQPETPFPQPGQPVQNRPGEVTQPGQPGQQQGDPYANIRTMVDQSLDKHVGFGGNMVIGGLSGMVFGGPVPWILNRTADTLLLDPNAEAASRRVLFQDGGWAKKILPNGLREGIEAVPEKYDQFLREKVAAPEGSMRHKAAQFWRENFDERSKFAKDLVKHESEWVRHNGIIDDLINKNQVASDALVNGKTVANMTAAEAAEMQRLRMRADWLKSDQWLSAKEGATQLEKVGNAAKDFAIKNKATGGELFSKAELEALAARQTALQTKTRLGMVAEEGAGFWGKGAFSNFVKGASFVGATMIADHYLDRMFFGKSHHHGLNDNTANELPAAPLRAVPFVGKPIADAMTSPGSLNTNALLLPLAFATTKPWSKEGLMLTAGALVGGKLLDKGFQAVFPQADTKSFTDVLRPTGVDALTMGGAFLIPTNDWRMKAGLVGASWAFGRMTNMDTKWSLATAGGLAATIGLSGLDGRTKLLLLGADAAAWGLSRVLHNGEGADKRALNDDAWNLLKKDAGKRTDGSMNDAIDKFYELGQAGKDRQLRFYYEDWLRPDRKFDDMLGAYRGAVAIGTAFGESRLKNGTLKAATDQPEFLLEGKDLDIGSQALRGFIIAKVNVDRAKQQTQNLLGQQNNGSEVKQSELADLDKVQKRIDAGVGKIYGKHDIEGASSELRAYYAQDTNAYGHLMVTVNGNIAKNLNGANKDFLAKQFRDAALLQITVADFKLKNGSDADGAAAALNGSTNQVAGGPPKQYSVWEAINAARQLSPNNPDLEQLYKMAVDLNNKMPAAHKAMISNPTYNGLNVEDGLNQGKK